MALANLMFVAPTAVAADDVVDWPVTLTFVSPGGRRGGERRRSARGDVPAVWTTAFSVLPACLVDRDAGCRRRGSSTDATWICVAPTVVASWSSVAARARRRVLAGADEAALLVVVERRLDRARRVRPVRLVPAEHGPELLEVHVLAHVRVVGRAVAPVARVHRAHRRCAAAPCAAGRPAVVRRDRRRVVVAREHDLLARAVAPGIVSSASLSCQLLVLKRWSLAETNGAELAVRLRRRRSSRRPSTTS